MNTCKLYFFCNWWYYQPLLLVDTLNNHKDILFVIDHFRKYTIPIQFWLNRSKIVLEDFSHGRVFVREWKSREWKSIEQKQKTNGIQGKKTLHKSVEGRREKLMRKNSIPQFTPVWSEEHRLQKMINFNELYPLYIFVLFWQM